MEATKTGGCANAMDAVASVRDFHLRFGALDAFLMRYDMPLREKRADGLVPSAQSLRGHECARGESHIHQS